VFGPPPSDIAIAATGAGNGRAGGLRRPLADRSPTSFGRPLAAAMPASRYGARFPAGVPFVPQGDVVAGGMKVGTIYFGSGSAVLGREDRAAIRRAVEAYRQRGGALRVVGHASSRTRDLDPMRHEMANFSISLDRANAVAREILRLGVDPAAVRVSAVSDTEPVTEEAMPSGEAGNRRAEILIEN